MKLISVDASMTNNFRLRFGPFLILNSLNLILICQEYKLFGNRSLDLKEGLEIACIKLQAFMDRRGVIAVVSLGKG